MDGAISEGNRGNSLLVPLHHRLVHISQDLQRELDVPDEIVAPVLAKVLTDHHAHQLQLLAVRRHRVRGHDPPALAELVRDGELVVQRLPLGVQAERDERQAAAAAVAHDDEAQLLELRGQVVGRPGEVEHDGAVAALAQADQLVVLADDLGGALGEVEREAGLLGAEVVDVEDQLFGEVLGGAPDDPANAGVDLTPVR